MSEHLHVHHSSDSAPSRRVARRRFPARNLHPEAQVPVGTAAGRMRGLLRRQRQVERSACAGCGRKLRPLQGDREWGRAFCDSPCVDSYAGRYGLARALAS